MIVVGTNSWVTLAEAEAYMLSRLGAGTYWKTGAAKEAALITAYKQLINHPDYMLSADATDPSKNAQCEQALFLLASGEGSEKRAALRAQGVKSAGIIGETYSDDPVDLPVSPMAKRFLVDSFVGDANLFSGTLERDETI